MDATSIDWTIAVFLAGGALTAWGASPGTSAGCLWLMSSPGPMLVMAVVSLPKLQDLTWRTTLSAAIGIFAGVCIVPGAVALLHNKAKAQTQMSGDNTAPSVGDNSVVYGRVSPNLRVGNNSVVVGATDSNGNTIITQPMAVGAGAYAGPGSIAIGAGAGAGMRPQTDQK
jgi:hypothetical protein